MAKTNKDGSVTMKITDFGFSTILQPGKDLKELVGTRFYAAPEILAGDHYDKSVDIYSMGVLMFVICLRKFPVLSDEGAKCMKKSDIPKF